MGRGPGEDGAEYLPLAHLNLPGQFIALRLHNPTSLDRPAEYSTLLVDNASVAELASEIAYPFYVWHQTVIIAIAFYVVQWPLGVGAKFVIIALAALVVSVALCEVVKMTDVTRFLFGMKAKKRPLAQAERT